MVSLELTERVSEARACLCSRVHVGVSVNRVFSLDKMAASDYIGNAAGR